MRRLTVLIATLRNFCPQTRPSHTWHDSSAEHESRPRPATGQAAAVRQRESRPFARVRSRTPAISNSMFGLLSGCQLGRVLPLLRVHVALDFLAGAQPLVLVPPHAVMLQVQAEVAARHVLHRPTQQIRTAPKLFGSLSIQPLMNPSLSSWQGSKTSGSHL